MLLGTIQDAAIYITDGNFLKNNPGFEEEKRLLCENKLCVDRLDSNNNVHRIFLKSSKVPKVSGRLEAAEAKYWYRGMNRDQFKYLLLHHQVYVGDSYCGIATNAAYAQGYLTNKIECGYVVEFDTYDVNFFNRLGTRAKTNNRVIQDPKAEGDGGTFGLGPTGHYKGDAGVCFNELLTDGTISWRLVYAKVTVV